MASHRLIRSGARAVLAIVSLGLLLALAAALSGCGSDFKAGRVVQSPPGWVDFCKRHPADPGCKGA